MPTILGIRTLRELLEDSVIHEPDDLLNHAAYADCLLEEGDPRGQFIQIQLSLERNDLTFHERTELIKWQQTLLLDHCREWLGDLADILLDVRTYDEYRFPFRRGWIDELHLQQMSPELQMVLPFAPEIRLMRKLTIRDSHGASCLFASPYLTNLRFMSFGELRGANMGGNIQCELLLPIFARTPRLETLHLFEQRWSFEPLFTVAEVPPIRFLSLHGNFDASLEAFCINPAWRNLEVLSLAEQEGYTPLTTLRLEPLFQSTNFPKLRRVVLIGAEIGSYGCTRLVQTGFPSRIEELVLANCELNDDSIERLCQLKLHGKLKRIDVANFPGHRNHLNRVTRQAVRKAQKAGLPITIEGELS